MTISHCVCKGKFQITVAISAIILVAVHWTDQELILWKILIRIIIITMANFGGHIRSITGNIYLDQDSYKTNIYIHSEVIMTVKSGGVVTPVPLRQWKIANEGNRPEDNICNNDYSVWIGCVPEKYKKPLTSLSCRCSLFVMRSNEFIPSGSTTLGVWKI